MDQFVKKESNSTITIKPTTTVRGGVTPNRGIDQVKTEECEGQKGETLPSCRLREHFTKGYDLGVFSMPSSVLCLPRSFLPPHRISSGRMRPKAVFFFVIFRFRVIANKYDERYL